MADDSEAAQAADAGRTQFGGHAQRDHGLGLLFVTPGGLCMLACLCSSREHARSTAHAPTHRRKERQSEGWCAGRAIKLR